MESSSNNQPIARQQLTATTEHSTELKQQQQQHHKSNNNSKSWRGSRNRKASNDNELSQSSSSTLSNGSQATIVAANPNIESKKKKSQSNTRSSNNNNSNASHRFNNNVKTNRNNSIDPQLISTSNHTVYSTKHGSKKTNLNHLLNFTYESIRESNDNYYEYERFTKQFWSMKLSKNSYFSKEQFLQANCQFVVKNNGDYSVHMADPDLLVDWDKIEEIHIGSHESMICPICLYPPQAGKMTKCGHVYCWSCILHYLALSDKAWRKCPICFESIYKNDLKSVKVIEQAKEFKVGDEISFNLMFKHKHKHNAIILPMSVHEQFLNDEKSIQNASVTFNLFNKKVYNGCHKYIKLHPKSDQQIYEDVIRREREELNKQIEHEKDQPEVCFVNEALEMLAEREQNLKLNHKNTREKKEETKEVEVDKKMKEDTIKPPEKIYADAFDDKLTESSKSDQLKDLLTKPTTYQQTSDEMTQQQQQQPKTEEIKDDQQTSDEVIQQQQSTNNNNNNSNNSSEFSYFYQSTDGQRIYINALNTRCLITEYNSFSQCPLVISGRIVACDSYFMSEENRKRYKYLSHLPLHSEFKVAELDLKEPIVNKKTLDQFKDEIEERKQMRARKEIREKRMADKIAASQAIEPSYYVQSAAEEINFMRNSNEAPAIDYSNEFPEASTSPTFSSGISISGNSNTSVSDSTSSSTNVTSQQAISFAQALKHRGNLAYSNKSLENKKKLNELDLWPSLESNSPTNATLNNNNNNSNSNAASNSNPLLSLNQANSTQITSGWLTMVKHQEQTTSGRTRKYQEAPTAWGLSNKNDALIASMVEQNSEDESSMPAPQYKESFFSSIDASLKLLESKGKSNTVFDDIDEPQEEQKDQKQTKASKKKKKTKQLLFSTSLNMGI